MSQLVLNMKKLGITICCFIVLSLTILPAQAERRSNGLAITLFVTGMGLKVGSTLMHTSAEKKYEAYLAATIQSDIQSLKDEVVTRNNASISMSRVGYGFIGLATILSIFNQLKNASIETATPAQIQNNATTNSQYPLNFAASPISIRHQSLGDMQMFSFLPHYDFQRQRVSLQFLHKF